VIKLLFHRPNHSAGVRIKENSLIKIGVDGMSGIIGIEVILDILVFFIGGG
jgi:hypothetical protein